MASTLIVDQLQKTGGSTTALTLPTSNASASEFLQNDGAGALSWASASAGFDKFTVVTASDSTFDLQSTTTKLVIEVQASGGTAGNCDASNYAGGSGGGGAYAMKQLTGITGATDQLNITIGAVPAASGAGTTTSVAQAGTASFATITCDGGNGGVTASGAYAAGGVGGDIPTTGDFNVAGGNGRKGGTYLAGAGGAWLARENGLTTDGAGMKSSGYGGGGSQGYGVSVVGGAGSLGVVIVWEYK